ncbi:MAG: lysozyme inhibitor LprI family protein [Burkholderiales bacterium]
MFKNKYLNKFRVSLAGIAFCSATGALAADSADPCAAAVTTIEINDCLNRQFNATDRELARVYQELLKRITGSDPQHVDRGTVQRRLEGAQRDWVTFRRQDCEGMYKLIEGGSIRNARFHSCMIDRTEKRIAELKEWDRP